jgi:hypothetical protein
MRWWQLFMPMQQKLKTIYYGQETYILFTCLRIWRLLSCKASQSRYPSTSTAGIFKVAILYPNGEDKTIDMDYYEKSICLW